MDIHTAGEPLVGRQTQSPFTQLGGLGFTEAKRHNDDDNGIYPRHLFEHRVTIRERGGDGPGAFDLES